MNKTLIITCLLALTSIFSVQAQEEKTIKTTSGKKLNIDSGVGGNLKIKGWEKSEVYVSIDHNFDDDEATFSITDENGNVTVKGKRKGKSNWGWGNNSVKYTVYVPATFDVELKTSGGNVVVSGISGKINGGTSGGNIDAKDLSGNINLATSGGNLDIENLEGDGKLATSGGNVIVSQLNGDFNLATSGGNISIKESEINGKAATSGGSISVNGTKGNLSVATSGGNISFNESEIDGTARTSGGSIKIDKANEGTDVATSGGNITINAARKFAIAKTSGGNILIREIDGKVEAKTSGGNIDVKMLNNWDGAHDAELITAGGEVTLYVPASMGMDFNIELQITKSANRDYKINSDFNMNISEGDWATSESSRKSRKKITGTGKVGNGKNSITIKTVNGDINIKKI